VAVQATGTLAACSLAMCGLRTRPRTDVDPPRVELPSAGGGISSRRTPGGDNLFACRFYGVYCVASQREQFTSATAIHGGEGVGAFC